MAGSKIVWTLSLVCLSTLNGGLALAVDSQNQPHIDHILLGAADLDRATEMVAKVTGVRPAYGGKHPRGTQNALLSLGGGSYLEIIALQPGAKAPAGFPDLAKLDNPAPIGWAVSGGDLESLRHRLEQGGFQLAPPEPGSRITPTGTTLNWQTFNVAHDFAQAPFFIVWSAGTPHPSTTSPAGCTLRDFVVASPDLTELKRLKSALALRVDLADSPKPGFTLRLDCPQGPVTFKGP
ncbi:MAG: hypothetical protein QOF89_28 [Acidobacteriota bacterium]|jgi:hypothetical protein|nr:hypothetical protein [Acidobacteriota bacterium]